ncbi:MULTISPECIES: carbamoyl phosphate synthase large subunit [unclassified Planococcus (in: firmicutes)]|uniref:carbamoyl phosphate synthase large subunit n=1 Tax=unclassified Planococcus (in: firmicutes) TaxID=2662419 RepID=UPI000C79EB52|nr:MULTISPECIES: carbamoyl phosphate synthase large subunit [unclassified Planococcus (in: firmicutes)]PKG44417.1 carbamoyl-phosphate synthase large subunit [Planococcus sp. Urea-trap-24]PKG91230.1 carbamoyl-phosphate synthase large subunit [Planococcus sp. Urea-3u-39]PKH39569.1 carbamoyl-phosphate synthase large subunit [Planococcus sp. MB-3u-09]
MPKLDSIEKVLVIGSGAIVIGQAAEFDYSGTQACLALKEEGIEVVLINNNPATIMTDESVSDKVYFEPMTLESATNIIEKERPDGLLATVGGQTGLNLAMALADAGILEQYGVELLGTDMTAIKKAEDRDQFRSLMKQLGEPVPDSDIIYSLDGALAFAERTGYPVIVRPAYTLGGFGGGIASDEATYIKLVTQGLSASPIKQCLVETSIAGYKEIEYEVMRDAAGTCITVCNMENLDPVGVHTGDSIVVAPSQTLNDPDFHMLRTSCINIIEALGIIGACNVQFALHPETSDYFLIEVNPRVSRSSALASKATGYPIAKIAAKLAIGYTLDELKNPVTGTTYASFEPALDYVALKIPRWPFDQFPLADRTLGTQMKATGEVMAIERRMEAAMQKALRSLELPIDGFRLPAISSLPTGDLLELAMKPDDRRLFVLFELLIRGKTTDELHAITGITPYFLYVLSNIVTEWQDLKSISWNNVTADRLLQAKKLGFSDQQMADIWNVPAAEIWGQRRSYKIAPAYRMIDTCAAEFRSNTNYFYSTWDNAADVDRSKGAKKVAVVGSGPIRIGQGIEFDYCCVHSVMAAQKLGYEAVMINNNPETVSTDYEVADALYFEPITAEDVLNVLEFEGIHQVILQFGGQTSLNLAKALEEAGITVLGSSVDLLDQMEDRDRFYAFLESIGLPTIPGTTANAPEEVLPAAEKLGFPVLLRPSYVIGGRGMIVLHNQAELDAWLAGADKAFPVLVDHFVTGKEAEADILTDGDNVWVSAIFEHIEGTGVHSGDSIASTPPVTLTEGQQQKLVDTAQHIARQLDYTGLFNIQFVYEEDQLFVMEINPRASRTAPISSKVTDVPLVQHATALLLGVPYDELGIEDMYNGQPDFTVKAPVFSHIKLPGLSPVLSPEMMSTGEVIGTAKLFEEALEKALTGASVQLAKLATGSTLFAARDSADYEQLNSWRAQGFTIVTEDQLSFNEWLLSKEAAAYIDFSETPDAGRMAQAAIHRLHAWSRPETAAAYAASQKTQSERLKGVLAQ